MARTVGQLKQLAAEQLHENPTSAVLTTFLFPRWVTQIRNRILSHTSWNWNKDLIELTWPAAAAGAGASVLYLPTFIDKIMTVIPGVGEGPIPIVTATEIDKRRPVTRGPYLVLHGYYGVEGELPAAGLVNVAAAGAIGQNALVEGLDVNNREIREDVIVPGAGNVNTVGVFKAGVGGVRRITLIGDGTGTPVITSGIVTAVSGGVNLIYLDSAWETSHDHRRTELHSIAGTTSTHLVRYWRKHFPLTRDQDIVDLPDVFDDLMELGILMKLAQLRLGRQEDVSELTVLKGEWNERLQELRAWDKREPGKKYSVRVRRQRGGSRR